MALVGCIVGSVVLPWGDRNCERHLPGSDVQEVIPTRTLWRVGRTAIDFEFAVLRRRPLPSHLCLTSMVAYARLSLE